MLLRAALAGVIALLVLLGVACLMAPPVPTPEAPFRPEDQPVAASGDAEPAGRREQVRVTGAGAETVNLRAEPGMAGRRLKALVDGVELELLGPDRTADGRIWRHVRDPSDGVEGWVSAEFLAPVTGP
jgi:hypothetical protein